MESNFYSDEFEQLIREKTEQYKMYPSEKVWKGVHSSLHTKRRWFIAGMFLLVTGTLFLAGKELISPSHPALAKKTAGSTITSSSLTSLRSDEEEEDRQTNTTGLRVSNSSSGTTKHTSSSFDETDEDQLYQGITITITDPVIRQPDLSEYLSKAVTLPAEVPALPVTAARTSTRQDIAGTDPAKAADMTSSNEEAEGGDNTSAGTGTTIETSGKNTLAKTSRTRNALTPSQTSNRPEVTAAAPNPAEEAAHNPASKIPEAIDMQKISWLQDYAPYHLTPNPPRDRKYWQVLFSPTVNYRTLSGGEPVSAKSDPTILNGPVAPLHPGDAKNYVDNAPALGFEVSGSLLYRLTRNLAVKAGLQFNFSRYKIQAYASNPQQTTIPLNSYYGYYLDSVNSVTTIRNFGGRTREILNNDYYQLSIPIGFELRLLGNEKLQLNLAGTIQPSYLLNTNAYLLTSDYTNYTKESSLFRRWNLNAGIQALLTYKISHDVNLQAGPEFRYQLLSTYISQYSIQEHLKGYGFQIGFIKSFKSF